MRRVLCVRRGGLGDTLLVLPILKAMRAQAPAARLHLAGVSEYADLLRRFGAVDEALSSEALQSWALRTSGEAATRARAFLRRFEWIVGDDEALAAAASAATRVTVFDPRIDGGGPAAGTLLERAGLAGPVDVALSPAPTSSPAAPFVVHPGSGGPAKCLPPDVLREAAAALARQRDVVVVLGPAEVERGLDAGWPATVAVVRPASVLELAEVLAGARAYLGHDSGPTHLAAALHVRTCAVFVTTDPAVWAPRGDHVRVLRGARSGERLAAEVVRWAEG